MRCKHDAPASGFEYRRQAGASLVVNKSFCVRRRARSGFACLREWGLTRLCGVLGLLFIDQPTEWLNHAVRLNVKWHSGLPAIGVNENA